MEFTAIYIILAMFAIYATCGVTLYVMQPRFMYQPVRELIAKPSDLGLSYEDVRFVTSDGVELHGWYVPVAASEFTVLFCHGNGGNISHCLDDVVAFSQLGVSCLVFDYRGYGKSQGRPSEQGTYLDVQAAYRWLRTDKRIPAQQIILSGRSLGGSVAAHLAMRERARALVLEGSFTSYAAMGRKFFPYMPVRRFARFNYSTVDYLQDVKMPVMIIHSRNDELVPPEFGRELYEAANEPKRFVEIVGGHNNGFLASGDVYKKAWEDWLAFLTAGPAGSNLQEAP
jgi:hypothetical protein